MSEQGILGHLVDEKMGIREDLSKNYFEFYVAGITQVYQGTPVQPIHRYIYETALELQLTSEMADLVEQPKKDVVYDVVYIGTCLWDIDLVPEPDNKHDKNAMLVVLTHQIEDSALPLRAVLGYVPKVISRAVLHQKELIKTGWVKKARLVHGKYCATKVAIPYRYEYSIDHSHLRRALNIME